MSKKKKKNSGKKKKPEMKKKNKIEEVVETPEEEAEENAAETEAEETDAETKSDEAEETVAQESESVQEPESSPESDAEDEHKKFSVKRALSRTIHTQMFKCLLLSFVMEFVMEALGRHSVFDALFFFVSSPVVYIYNASIIFFTMLFAFFLRKRLFGIILVNLIWLIAGVVNFVVLGYRVTPFAAIDILMARDVMSMLDVYFTKWQMLGFVVIGIIVIVGLVLLFRKTPKLEGSIHIKRTMLITLLTWLILFVFTKFNIRYNIISDDFANLGMAYKDYGFAYCFTNSIIDNGIGKPDGYSEERMLEIKETLDAVQEELPEKKRKQPNIIVIQLESFFDTRTVMGLETDKDPNPNFTAFKEEFPSGYFWVPAFGAGTANTEFEVLTGMKSSYFGAGEYPYKTTVNSKPCVSMCSLLAAYGYGTYAIHNNTAAFYDRKNVYNQMGFDHFTSMEYMYDLQKTPTGWSKDVTLPEDILRCLDDTEGSDFVFTISVQGHGRYPDAPYDQDVDHISMSYPEENIEQPFHYYLNQVYEMDEMIGDLKKQLDERGEDYVLLLYGDHLPSLDLTDEKLTDGNVFQTEYVLVNNIGLDLPDKDILASEVSNRIFEGLGFAMSYEQLAKKVYEGEELDEVQTLLAYDMLFGENYIYGGKPPVPAPHMQFGVLKIAITDMYNEEDHVVVKGENFNSYSVVFEDDDSLDTVYIDSNTLMVEDYAIDPEKQYTVHQIDKSKRDLSASEVYIKQE